MIRPANHLFDQGQIIVRTRLDPVRHCGCSVVVTGLAAVMADPDLVARYEQLHGPGGGSQHSRDGCLRIAAAMVTIAAAALYCSYAVHRAAAEARSKPPAPQPPVAFSTDMDNHRQRRNLPWAAALAAPFKRARDSLARDIMADRAYTYHISWSAHDHMFTGTCTEFPGLTCAAPDPHTALQAIMDAVRAEACTHSGPAGPD